MIEQSQSVSSSMFLAILFIIAVVFLLPLLQGTHGTFRSILL